MRKIIVNVLLISVSIILSIPILLNDFKADSVLLSFEQKGTYSVTLTSASKLTLLEGKFALTDCQESYQFYNELFTEKSSNINSKTQSINLSSGEKLAPTTALFGDFSSHIYENNGLCHFYLTIINSKNNPYPDLILEKIINGYVVTSTQGLTLRFSFLY
jgi:hypothetical protein